MASSSHLVIPGQLIAVSQDGEEESSFLRGHGTYLEREADSSQLRASVTGTVQRVNKLISVLPLTYNRYESHVGDLVVGRITAVSLNRWKVQLVSYQYTAALPLSGVHLPGGVQRVRTQQDAREMRMFLKEGDLVSAEVHKIMNDGVSVQLHTRSTRYGKLENGCFLTVPPGLIPKRKNHYVSNFLNQFDVLLGCNGWVWMQRQLKNDSINSADTAGGEAPLVGGPELVELQEAQRAQHAQTPYSLEERQNLSRLRNSIECLRFASALITVENMGRVYQESIVQRLAPRQMLHHVLELTECMTQL
mmetsp:Transcript_21441/g.27727  ORF Transcript_21441/g.27727 Transcript_21441/m.27727 type:complete len:305 (+) Transcript_21441:86-1000(+)|eukprot:CAMPEP_0198153286 /NCGR_PEP_ID=MMETSP1443-20131203/63468_1 /TAXON_ID=186043 /ORGANISM="Entomoneis sp., Strain CCMP2396" /LENGTH=304 /DNA_ID=CAMNT_0043819565 /DNA_START=19 /DNA_END=933 /DNA_ORIENTATION=-